MVKSQNLVPNKKELQLQAQNISLSNTLPKSSTIIQVSRNATAQNQSNAILQESNAGLCEYTNLSRVATSSVLYSQFASKIKDLKKTIVLEEKKLKQLKGNAAAQQQARKKKKEMLEEENIVKIYDAPGRPSFLINESNLFIIALSLEQQIINDVKKKYEQLNIFVKK
ncbi:hypothetical protein RhiirA4_481954 [Rhizophagus irregularis]|uniref:Uncharacterized protein n=1 Tax=Rhizophagus irregularis TaxID=588596 RepID=A0A2I1HKB8_9GLOM|nr:hypothetical protein RhiirA4_481954 [Rhizophagus irregularis]